MPSVDVYEVGDGPRTVQFLFSRDLLTPVACRPQAQTVARRICALAATQGLQVEHNAVVALATSVGGDIRQVHAMRRSECLLFTTRRVRDLTLQRWCIGSEYIADVESTH